MITDTLTALWVLAEARWLDPTEISYSNAELKKLSAKRSVLAEEFYRTCLGRKQFTLYGDTNHSDRRIHHFFFSSENAGYIIGAGIRHVFLEREPKTQDLFDALGQGTLSQESFVARYKEFVPAASHGALSRPAFRDLVSDMMHFCRTMYQHGIKVHCIDDRSDIAPKDMEAVFTFMRDVEDHIRSKGSEVAIIHGRAILSFISENINFLRKNPQLNRSLKAVIAARSDDRKLAEDISRVAGEDNGAILFGAAHGIGLMDLDEFLGQEKVLRVNIHGQKELYADRLLSMKRMRPHYDRPDFLHMLDDGLVYEERGLVV